MLNLELDVALWILKPLRGNHSNPSFHPQHGKDVLSIGPRVPGCMVTYPRGWSTAAIYKRFHDSAIFEKIDGSSFAPLHKHLAGL